MLVLAGAGHASAAHSVFCKENVAVCPGAGQYPAESNAAGSISNEVAGTFAEVEIPGLATLSCSAAKVTGYAVVNKEGPMTGKGYFSSSVCSPEGCSFHSVGEHLWEWESTGGGDGTVTMSNPVLRVICTKSPAFTCDYGAAAANAEFEGGPGGEAFIADEGTALEMVNAGSIVCNFYVNAILRFRYFVVSPSLIDPVYLTN